MYINYDELPKKQQDLIVVARGLFSKHGTRRVTIEEICKKAGISKMTFYKYFSNKWDIAGTVLDIIVGEVVTAYNQMVEENIPFEQKVEKMLKLNREQVNAFGAAFINDLLADESPLREKFIGQQIKSKEMTIEFFKKAQKEGHIRRDIEMPFLLFMLNRLYELLNHPEFVQIAPDVEDRIDRLSKMFFHGFARTPK